MLTRYRPALPPIYAQHPRHLKCPQQPRYLTSNMQKSSTRPSTLSPTKYLLLPSNYGRILPPPTSISARLHFQLSSKVPLFMSKRQVKKPEQRKFTESEIQELKRTFDGIDKDGNGRLDEAEIQEFLKTVDLEPAYAGLIIRVFDKDGNDSITFTEFQQYIAVMAEVEDDPTKLFRLLFEAIDSDGSGSIDANEMVEFLSYLGTEMSLDEAKEAIKELDTDGNGRIDFEELCQALEL